ncbi:Transcriptional regulator, AcrR family [hydrothermal vent metagenome]|uniref:Transcriptional regulator, AcrR family n=1 Tax=hydrothermal vent metagenome TaxID=652676 RepID=A0A3B0URV3_9ZZZZ
MVKLSGKMNSIKKDNTEQKIMDAAHAVFLEKGMDGARMQEIANEAGINKALLHYYFRTKQKLFEAIFKRVIKHSFPIVSKTLLSDIPIREKMDLFIDSYLNLLSKNPFLPAFLLKEIHRDPEFLANVIKGSGINPDKILTMLGKEMDKGNIRRMNPRDLITNIIALSVFPFAAKPLLSIMLFNGDQKAYKIFLQERRETVKEFIFNAIFLK